MNKQQPSRSAGQTTHALAWQALLLAALVLASGCASAPRDEEGAYDPWEKANRPIYDFNMKLDKAIFKPVADTYIEVTPQPVRTSVSNFYDNISYPNAIINDFLQGKVKQGFADIGRFAVNTALGGLGLFDVATELGLEAHDEDFGQTLGVWGTGPGAYLVLPLLGPSTVRDAPGLAVDAVTNVLFYVDSTAVTAPLGVLGAIDTRARAAGAFEFIDTAALDPYIFTREAYLQHREYLIYDGNPPPPKFFDDWDDDAALPPPDTVPKVVTVDGTAASDREQEECVGPNCGASGAFNN